MSPEQPPCSDESNINSHSEPSTKMNDAFATYAFHTPIVYAATSTPCSFTSVTQREPPAKVVILSTTNSDPYQHHTRKLNAFTRHTPAASTRLTTRHQHNREPTSFERTTHRQGREAEYFTRASAKRLEPCGESAVDERNIGGGGRSLRCGAAAAAHDQRTAWCEVWHSECHIVDPVRRCAEHNFLHVFLSLPAPSRCRDIRRDTRASNHRPAEARFDGTNATEC